MPTTTTDAPAHSIWWEARKSLAVLGSFVILALIIGVFLLGIAYHQLAKQQDIANCKSLYSTPLSNRRDDRQKIVGAGLHALGANDPAGVATATNDLPALERTITPLEKANNRAVALAARHPNVFLRECHARK